MCKPLYFLLAFILSNVVQAQTVYPHQLARYSEFNGESVMGVDQAAKLFFLVGPIDQQVAQWLTRVQASYPDIKTLYIDSAGGEAKSALTMANLLETHQIKLVVDGRCFSACAQILFVAAPEKVVLSNAMLGIHTPRYSFNGKELDPNTLGSADGEVLKETDLQKLKDLASQIDRFSRRHQLKPELLQLMAKQRDKLALLKPSMWQRLTSWLTGKSNSLSELQAQHPCGKIKLWLLNQQQLQQMGVRGIKQFWFPAKQSELDAFFYHYDLKPTEFFIGDKNRYLSLCN